MDPPPMAKRAFYGKVRTGCVTCKLRKVKCDEGKPWCRRCVSTGRTCDGYRLVGSKALKSAAEVTSSAASSPRFLASQSALFASAAERRSFYYFQTRASKPLAGYFNVSFWTRDVMLAAIHYEPIRHLIIALGAAYESFEASQPKTTSIINSVLAQTRHNDGAGDSGMNFALQQCNHAIRKLAAMSDGTSSSYPSAEATFCVLTASVLFVYFASLRYHMAEAIQHVRSAAKVLRDFTRSQPKAQRQLTPSPKPLFPVSVSQLQAVITSVFGQLRTMSDDVALEELQTGNEDLLVSPVEPATVFASVSEAHAYFERLYHNSLAFLQQTTLQPPDPTDAAALESIVARHRELCRALDSSWDALDVLSASLGASPGAWNSDQQTEKDGVLVLRIYHHLISMRLRIDVFRPEQRESAFDGMEAHLEEMLALCEQLVENQRYQYEKEGLTPTGASCSSGLGYVMPLHTIAARCRNPRVRRRALHLLLTTSRREGIWDSYLAGQIVSQTLEIEEQANALHPAGQEDMPAGEGRVHEVKIRLQGDKKVLLHFITVADLKQGRSGTARVIQW